MLANSAVRGIKINVKKNLRCAGKEDDVRLEKM